MSRYHVLYWIWLSLCISPGSRASDLLLEYFDEDAQKIYEAGKADYDRLDLSEDVKARLLLKSQTHLLLLQRTRHPPFSLR